MSYRFFGKSKPIQRLNSLSAPLVFVGLAVAGSFAESAFARPMEIAGDSLPPVGERLYVIKENQTSASTEIIPEEAASEVDPLERVMRDPKAPDVEMGFKIVREMKQPKTKPLKVKPVVLKLPSLEVKGNQSRPRMPFALRRLEIDRADEPVHADFVPRVFDDARLDF